MIRASDLLGAVVRTEGGEKLGRVHDLRAHSPSEGEWLLMGIVVGPRGLLVRFQGGAPDAAVRSGNVIPWEAITRLEEGLVVVRDEVAATPTP
jgi:sporulation protein YlmC with PRC-barrel domain